MEGTENEAVVYDGFLEECMLEPLSYFFHDCDARLSDELRRGTALGGFEWLGRWWTFVECISSKKGHMYDVSDEIGWKFFRLDMVSGGGEMSVDDCKEFVGELYELKLINREVFDESKRIISDRVMRNAEKSAEATAKRKLAAWKTNQKRYGSR